MHVIYAYKYDEDSRKTLKIKLDSHRGAFVLFFRFTIRPDFSVHRNHRIEWYKI